MLCRIGGRVHRGNLAASLRRMNSVCPIGTPSATKPQVAGSLSPPHQTSGPSASTSGGGRWTRVLPRFAATPACRSTVRVTSSNAGRARAGVVTRYRSSKKSARNSPGSNRPCAAARASCCARGYKAGAKASPCSQPSPCEITCERNAGKKEVIMSPPYASYYSCCFVHNFLLRPVR